MRLNGAVLSADERERIHRDSIGILEETGVRVPSERALSLLAAHGADVNFDTKVARIPETLVTEALARAPKSYTLGGRDPAYDLPFPSTGTVYNLDGCGVSTFDCDTWKKRPTVLADVEDAARVFDSIDCANVIWIPCAPSDVAPGPRNIIGSAACLKYCGKHLQDEVKKTAETPFVIALLKALLGSDEEVRRRKIYSLTYCTIAPLQHDAEMLEATMDMSHWDVPILPYPMPGAGSTGPGSLYSNVALANAEILSAIVIFELESPGVPIIFGSALGAVNMRSCLFIEGAAETALQSAAMAEMGRRYGLPTMVAGCLTDAKEPGMQSVLEKFTTTWPLVQSGANVIQGIGLIESSMTLSLEHMIIDEEIALVTKRLTDGVRVADDRDFSADVNEVGPGGHFLMQQNTLDIIHSDEYYLPRLAYRDTYDSWIAAGSPDMMTRAHERVREILAAEQRSPLSASTLAEIEEVTEEASAKLGAGEK
jgi:trimethylamine--corrinoid protein Co-methyltransferase